MAEIRNDPTQGGPPPGKPMFVPPSAATFWRLGWVLAVIGVLLAAGMGFLLFELGPGMLQPGQRSTGPHYTGTHQQAVSFLFLFSLVFLFGLNALIGGVRMIRTGRRSKWTIRFVFGLLALILGVCWSILSQ